MKAEYSELAQYILRLCKTQNLSLRQASIRSGLDPTTIAKMLRRDGINTPTPETLAKMAEKLNGDFYHMMSLAGHLPPDQAAGTIDDAELYAKFQRLQELVQQVAEQDPEAARRLMGLVITPFEVMLALEDREAEVEMVADATEMV